MKGGSLTPVFDCQVFDQGGSPGSGGGFLIDSEVHLAVFDWFILYWYITESFPGCWGGGGGCMFQPEGYLFQPAGYPVVSLGIRISRKQLLHLVNVTADYSEV